MKIFYAVQATGNGHISRAMELLPWLEKKGTVDLFLSGDNSQLNLDAPVRYRSKGISLYYSCKGGLSYSKMFKNFSIRRIQRDINDLPVEKYDLVINDFDFITAAACKRKKIPSVNFGHQASFQSNNVPRPKKKNLIGEQLLRHFAKADHYIGLHFDQYDDFIFKPVIKKEILEAEPQNKGHVTVYLPSYCVPELISVFGSISDMQFEIFCREISQPEKRGNLLLLPVSKSRFDESFRNCYGIITGGGFETPAEALHMGKKLMAIPIKGQYEQQCNAAALEKIGVMCTDSIGEGFHDKFDDWMNSGNAIRIDYSNSIPQCMNRLFSIAETLPHFESSAIEDLSMSY
jgi:uncharacterized protein (TIGR00661 family)